LPGTSFFFASLTYSLRINSQRYELPKTFLR